MNHKRYAVLSALILLFAASVTRAAPLAQTAPVVTVARAVLPADGATAQTITLTLTPQQGAVSRVHLAVNRAASPGHSARGSIGIMS